MKFGGFTLLSVHINKKFSDVLPYLVYIFIWSFLFGRLSMLLILLVPKLLLK